MNEFIFVGYLIQEPYWQSWPKRAGYRVASIEREFHPEFNKPQWKTVQGIENPTEFLTEFPHLDALSLEPHRCQSVLHKQSPGWVVSGMRYRKELSNAERSLRRTTRAACWSSRTP